MKNKEEKKLEYAESPRTIMVEKLIMNELLNAEDFDVLLRTTEEEFRKTFCCSKNNEFSTKEKIDFER